MKGSVARELRRAARSLKSWKGVINMGSVTEETTYKHANAYSNTLQLGDCERALYRSLKKGYRAFKQRGGVV